MNIGNYDLTQTNDGDGIYINAILVDDKKGCPNYWKGWDEWVKILSVTDLYDYWKRNEIIMEVRNKYNFTALGIPKEYFGKENELDLNIIKRKSIYKTKEDVIFSFTGLEGTLKNNGTYEYVLKAMDKYSEEKFSQKELLDAINFIIQLIHGKENISNKELKEQGYVFIQNLKSKHRNCI